jgi:hypothetical protein
MASLIPARKVWASGLAGIAAAILSALLREYAGLDIPSDTSALIIAMIVPAVGYLVPPAARDVVMEVDKAVRTLGQGEAS